MAPPPTAPPPTAPRDQWGRMMMRRKTRTVSFGRAACWSSPMAEPTGFPAAGGTLVSVPLPFLALPQCSLPNNLIICHRTDGRWKISNQMVTLDAIGLVGSFHGQLWQQEVHGVLAAEPSAAVDCGNDGCCTVRALALFHRASVLRIDQHPTLATMLILCNISTHRL